MSVIVPDFSFLFSPIGGGRRYVTWSHCTIKLLVYKLYVLVKSHVTSIKIEVGLSGK